MFGHRHISSKPGEVDDHVYLVNPAASRKKSIWDFKPTAWTQLSYSLQQPQKYKFQWDRHLLWNPRNKLHGILNAAQAVGGFERNHERNKRARRKISIRGKVKRGEVNDTEHGRDKRQRDRKMWEMEKKKWVRRMDGEIERVILDFLRKERVKMKVEKKWCGRGEKRGNKKRTRSLILRKIERGVKERDVKWKERRRGGGRGREDGEMEVNGKERRQTGREWDGYRPSETALMPATGAAVSTLETSECVCVCVCVCVCLTGLTVFTDRQQWPHHALGAFRRGVRLSAVTQTHAHTHTRACREANTHLCTFLFPLFCLNLSLGLQAVSRIIPSTHRDELRGLSKFIDTRILLFFFFPFAEILQWFALKKTAASVVACCRDEEIWTRKSSSSDGWMTYQKPKHCTEGL